MATTIFGYPQKDIELIGGPLGTKYSVVMIDHDWKTTEANLGAALWGVGAGVIKYPDATSFNVTAGTGRSVNIAAGRAIVVHSTTGPAGINSYTTIALTNITASTTQNLFLKQETSVKDGRPAFDWADSSTTVIDGMVWLATVTTSGSAVTSVVMNPDRFADNDLSNRKSWDSTRTFYENDVVTNSGTKWLALRTNTNVTPIEGADWTSLAGSASGGAGGVLSGSYPNPGFAVDMATQAELDAAIGTVGGVVSRNQTAHGLMTNDWIRLNGSNFVKAQADSFGNSQHIGRVVSTTTNAFTFVEEVYQTGLSGLTAGALYYLSPTTAGAMTTTIPAALGQWVRPVFYADTTTSGWVLSSTSTPALIGTDQIATGGQISKEQLEYIPASDIANAAAITAETWTDVIPVQNFTVDRTDSRQMTFIVSGCINISSASSGGFSARLWIDNSIEVKLGGNSVTPAKPENILVGAGTPRRIGLTAGAHTVVLQVRCEVAASLYLRASSRPIYENFALRIVENKR